MTTQHSSMTLFRPTGWRELLLIYRSRMRTFPPRLPQQPFFYPVTTEGYAEKIAHNWNCASDERSGYVTSFRIESTIVRDFPVQTVGGKEHEELWVPAEELTSFNARIVGQIAVTKTFFARDFAGLVPERFSLRGREAKAQLEALCSIHKYSLMDLHGEVAANHEAVFLHFPFWRELAAGAVSVDRQSAELVLSDIMRIWEDVSPDVPLP